MCQLKTASLKIWPEAMNTHNLKLMKVIFTWAVLATAVLTSGFTYIRKEKIDSSYGLQIIFFTFEKPNTLDKLVDKWNWV